MARARLTVLLEVFPEKIWQDMIFTPGFSSVPPAIEVMPIPLLFRAAITPATWVPWPVSAELSQEMIPVLLMKSYP